MSERRSGFPATSFFRLEQATITCTILILALHTSAINASACAGLPNDNGREQRQLRADPIPDPPRNILARGVIEPVYLIEVIMVQHLIVRVENLLDVGKV